MRVQWAMSLITDPSVIARFWAKVDKSGDCWIWTAGQNGRGYGSFMVLKGAGAIGAHCYSWILANGVNPPVDHGVHHSCDNPICVRPEHLWTGTQQENILDMIRKGRLQKYKVKFSDAEVLAVRNDLRPQAVIARAYGMSCMTVSRIKNNLRRV